MTHKLTYSKNKNALVVYFTLQQMESQIQGVVVRRTEKRKKRKRKARKTRRKKRRRRKNDRK